MTIIGLALVDGAITSTTSGQAVTAITAFTTALLNTAEFMTVTAHDGAILYRMTGNNPVLASRQGHVINAGETYTITGKESIERFRFLTLSGSPVVYFTIYTTKPIP